MVRYVIFARNPDGGLWREVLPERSTAQEAREFVRGMYEDFLAAHGPSHGFRAWWVGIFI